MGSTTAKPLELPNGYTVACESPNTETSYILANSIDQSKLFLRLLTFADEGQLFATKLLLTEYSLKLQRNEQITKIMTISEQNNIQICNKTFTLSLLFEYSSLSLEEEVKARRSQKAPYKYFDYEDLCSIVFACLSALWFASTERKALFSRYSCSISRMSQQNIFIRPSSVLIMSDGSVRISDPIIQPENRYEFNQKAYYAPQKMMEFARDDSSDIKSAIFELGMTLLHTAILEPLHDCYNGYELMWDQISERLDRARFIYGSKPRSTVLGNKTTQSTIMSQEQGGLRLGLVDLIEQMIQPDVHSRWGLPECIDLAEKIYDQLLSQNNSFTNDNELTSMQLMPHAKGAEIKRHRSEASKHQQEVKAKPCSLMFPLSYNTSPHMSPVPSPIMLKDSQGKSTSPSLSPSSVVDPPNQQNTGNQNHKASTQLRNEQVMFNHLQNQPRDVSEFYSNKPLCLKDLSKDINKNKQQALLDPLQCVKNTINSCAAGSNSLQITNPQPFEKVGHSRLEELMEGSMLVRNDQRPLVRKYTSGLELKDLTIGRRSQDFAPRKSQSSHDQNRVRYETQITDMESLNQGFHHYRYDNEPNSIFQASSSSGSVIAKPLVHPHRSSPAQRAWENVRQLNSPSASGTKTPLSYTNSSHSSNSAEQFGYSRQSSQLQSCKKHHYEEDEKGGQFQMHLSPCLKTSLPR